MPRIIYIHVPKCGGSSFGAALRLRFLGRQATITLGQGNAALSGEARIISDYEARGRELHALVAAGKQLIAGHVRYDPDLHAGAARDYRFVTLLREPMARFVSHYNYLQRKHPDRTRPGTLERFLDTPDAARLASQYLFYFAGTSQANAPDLPQAISRAITHLTRFDLVGDLAAPNVFARDLRRLTHTPILISKRNVAPDATVIPAPLRPRIAALCAADTAIYSAVLSAQNAA
ncbi:MAG: sulfotransferase family 2 domain-containing protein [Pseudomonadota bacterium]